MVEGDLEIGEEVDEGGMETEGRVDGDLVAGERDLEAGGDDWGGGGSPGMNT